MRSWQRPSSFLLRIRWTLKLIRSLLKVFAFLWLLLWVLVSITVTAMAFMGGKETVALSVVGCGVAAILGFTLIWACAELIEVLVDMADGVTALVALAQSR